MDQLIKCAAPQMGDDEVEAVAEVIRSGQLCSGPTVERFEAAFAEWLGARPQECIAVNSGTAALHLAYRAAGVGPGRPLITTPLTFASTATAALMCDARVIFADVGDDLQMDPDHANRLMLDNPGAVLAPVHYLGGACDWSRPYDRTVVEDCAQAHGTTYDGDGKVGRAGDTSCFSFFATKHLSTGEGGMVVVNHGDDPEYIRQMRAHGLRGRWQHEYLGYNYRMTEIAAAIGLVQLEKLDRLNAARVAVSEQLLGGIQDIPWLSSPARTPTPGHTYFWCPAVVDEKALGFSTQELVRRLREAGVEVRYRYPVPLYRLPVFLKLNNPQPAPLPNAERLAGRFIGLPNRPDMAAWEIERVLEVLHGIEPVQRWSI